jgi:hypothetical protein
MANAKIGSRTSWNNNYVESITTTKQLERGDSGKVFMIDSSGGAFDINLPDLSSNIAGWSCKMIVQASGASGAVSVLAYGLPTAGGGVAVSNDAEQVHYREISLADETGNVAGSKDGFTIETASVIGDYFDIVTDGTTWFVNAHVHEIAHANAIDS